MIIFQLLSRNRPDSPLCILIIIYTNFIILLFYHFTGKPSLPLAQPKLYNYLGCWKESSSYKAVPSLEGTNSLLKDSYSSRDYAIYLCYLTAKARGFHIFALNYNGMCMGMRGSQRYQKYGKATTCKNGKGYSAYANDVYSIGGIFSSA